jgi:hypothetical protein
MSRAIQLIKNDEYTHASITFDSELNYMYSFGRKYKLNPLLGHFKKEEPHSGLFGLQKELPSKVFELTVTPTQYYRAKALLDAFVEEKDKYKYNYMGIIHSFQKKSYAYEDRFLCSEFVYHILKESAILNLKMPRNLVRPEHLKNIGWPVYFEGDLKAHHPIEAGFEDAPNWLGLINKKLTAMYSPFL